MYIVQLCNIFLPQFLTKIYYWILLNCAIICLWTSFWQWVFLRKQKGKSKNITSDSWSAVNWPSWWRSPSRSSQNYICRIGCVRLPEPETRWPAGGAPVAARQGLTLLDSDNANCQHLVGACHLSAPAPSETWRSVITCRGKLASVKHGEV